MKFTKEKIAQQREIGTKATPRPWSACRDGECKCKQIWGDDYPVTQVTHGDWGDDYPTLKMTGGSLDAKVEAVMKQITYGHIPDELSTANAKLIVEYVNTHEAALDEIERLEARKTYLSTFLEEAAHAAAQGKDPSQYLATAAPTTLRDEIKRLRAALSIAGNYLKTMDFEDEKIVREALKGGGNE